MAAIGAGRQPAGKRRDTVNRGRWVSSNMAAGRTCIGPTPGRHIRQMSKDYPGARATQTGWRKPIVDIAAGSVLPEVDSEPSAASQLGRLGG